MPCTLKVDGPTRRTLSFEIERARLREEIDRRLSELARRTNFKGFRPGKAPMSLVRKSYGEKAADEARRAVMSKAFQEAIEEHKLQPVGDPELNLKLLEDADDGPFTFELAIEVAPDFELKPLEGIPVTVELPDVDEEMVTRELERFRQRGAKVEDAPAGHSADEDSVLSCNVTYVVDGQDLAAREDRVVFVKHDIVDGVTVPGSGESFRGRKVGDSVEVELDLPDHFEPEEHRGRRAIARVAIEGHRRVVVPEIGEEMLKQAGMASVEELTERIRQELGLQREQMQSQAVDRRIEEWLVENHPLELPERLAKKAIERRVHEHAHQLMERQGLSSEEGHHKAEEERERITAATRRALHASFVIGRIAREQQLSATPDETAEQIRLIAQAQKADPDAALRESIQEGWFQDVAANLTEQKVRDWLRSRATVTVTAPAAPPAQA